MQLNIVLLDGLGQLLDLALALLEELHELLVLDSDRQRDLRLDVGDFSLTKVRHR